jgi:hypothetical protein
MKTTMGLRKSIFLLCFLFSIVLANGQDTQNSTSKSDSVRKEKKKLNLYTKEPVWVNMMDDPSVNYFEAEKAFKAFWKDRKVPIEDDIVIDGKVMKEHEEDRSIIGKILHAKEEKQEKELEQYRFEHKRFKHWQLTVEPYVQEDGRILSNEEILEIWKQQRQ